MSFPIFSQNGFTIGIGDSNRDGKLDFDFGLRSEAFGNGPFGYGSQGAEIGFNTQRGVYAGADYSNFNAFGAHGGGGRVYSDGGFQSGSWSNDIFGNYHRNYENAGPFHYEGSQVGGNFRNGNYYGHHAQANPFEASQSSWAGNSWNGAHVGHHSYGNIFGQGCSSSNFTPPFVPSYGGHHYRGCGCGSVAGFMGW